MKRSLYWLVVGLFLFGLSAGAALAGGDKNHGSKAQGDPPQYCMEPGDCPWE